MSIKNRLSKIEDKFSVNSEFCNCPGITTFKVIPFGEKVAEPETTYCKICGKSNSNHSSITFNISGNAEIKDLAERGSYEY